MRVKKMDKIEFVAWHKSTEQGSIRAWKYVISLCESLIRSHREELKQSRVDQLWKNYKSFHENGAK